MSKHSDGKKSSRRGVKLKLVINRSRCWNERESEEKGIPLSRSGDR